MDSKVRASVDLVVKHYLPNWPIDRLRRAAGDAAPPADRPLVLGARVRRPCGWPSNARASRAANLIVWKDRFEKYRREILGAQLMAATGRVQREGEVVHLIVQKAKDISGELGKVPEAGGQAGGREMGLGEMRLAPRNFR